MSNVNDKAAIQECATFLGSPPRFLYRICRPRRVQLDHDNEAQLQLQAILFDTLFSRDGSHPWDRMSGRSFRQLVCYFSWLIASRDRIIICTNTPERIASYLLPHARSFSDRSFEISGIPGLRLDGFGTGTIHLQHLPSGGRLDLRDTCTSNTRHLRTTFAREIAMRTKSERGDDRLPVYTESVLSNAERSDNHWRTNSSTWLRAALLARANLWWNAWHHDATIVNPRRSNSIGGIRWTNCLHCGQIGWLLTESALRIPNSDYEPRSNGYDVALLKHDATVIEMNGPA